MLVVRPFPEVWDLAVPFAAVRDVRMRKSMIFPSSLYPLLCTDDSPVNVQAQAGYRRSMPAPSCCGQAGSFWQTCLSLHRRLRMTPGSQNRRC